MILYPPILSAVAFFEGLVVRVWHLGFQSFGSFGQIIHYIFALVIELAGLRVGGFLLDVSLLMFSIRSIRSSPIESGLCSKDVGDQHFVEGDSHSLLYQRPVSWCEGS